MPVVRVPGFRAYAVHSGLKARQLDLALIASDKVASAAGVFTTSQVQGAPVLWTRKQIASGQMRGLVINAGNANVATGPKGSLDTRKMAKGLAKELHCPTNRVLVASTGVIGVPLPMTKVLKGIKSAAKGLNQGSLSRVARAMMTTDTVPKLESRRLTIDGKEVTLVGLAKGSGMIEPNMATMLAFLLTDVSATPGYLRRLLSSVTKSTFNRVTIDAQTSTSDMALLLASEEAGNRRLTSRRSKGSEIFEEGLISICDSLARSIAKDGEGASKLLVVEVTGGPNTMQAERAGRLIANSMLVKTAINGGDPNWGRIVQALGAGSVPISTKRLTISIGGVTVFKLGVPAGSRQVSKAAGKMKNAEISLQVDLGRGRSSARIYSCDLSREYVSINADYTT